jgi:hypothetical protein
VNECFVTKKLECNSVAALYKEEMDECPLFGLSVVDPGCLEYLNSGF